MSATLHSLAPQGLQVALLPGAGAHGEAIIRACLDSDVRVSTGAAGPNSDVALVWWDGASTQMPAGGQEGIPVVALCVGGPALMAAALDAGADHALPLPITSDLLRSVCGAFARRRPTAPRRTVPARSSTVLALDQRAHTLRVHGALVQLTLREFDLLTYLLANAGAACSREEILEHVWGIDFETGTNTVDVFVYALRRKLATSGVRNGIETVRGVGYRLSTDLLK